MRRRTVLSLSASVALGGLAGCDGQRAAETPSEEPTTAPPTTGPTTESPREPTPQQPAECSVTQGLDVDWPDGLSAASAEGFVERYEEVYYRDVVVEYEPETRFDEYDLGFTTEVTDTDSPGYVVEVDGSGGIYRPDVFLNASVVDEEPDDEVIPLADVNDQTLREMLQTSAGNPEESVGREIRDGSDVDQYADLLNDFPGEGSLEGRGDSVTRYFDVDGTTVELTASVTGLHGDYWWTAWYYVDENVLRRTEDEEVAPENGELLECRADD